jgi:hypothetical protein
MDLSEIGERECVDWIDLAQDTDTWQAFMTTMLGISCD